MGVHFGELGRLKGLYGSWEIVDRRDIGGAQRRVLIWVKESSDKEGTVA